MNIKVKIKQIISIILVASQVALSLAGCSGSKDSGEGSLGDLFKKSFEVAFMLPDDATEFDIAETWLPEKVTVSEDTLISELPASERTSCMFVGYSYDQKGKEIAAENAKIDKDLTLYPVFELKEGMTNVFDLNFVSGEDVSSDFNLDVATYGLSEDEIREILTITDLSVGEEISYVLTETGSVYLDNLGIPEERIPYVKNAIEANRVDPEKDLTETLDAMGLELGVLGNIVMLYAPEERTELFEKYKKVMKEEGTGTVSDDVIDRILEIGTNTEAELKAKLGLSEDDSLERYWREDLGYSIEDILRLSEVVKANSSFRETERYKVTPDGEWTKGNLFQVEIDNTERLRFVFGDEICTEYITYYNFTVGREEVQNMTVDSGVIFLPYKDVEGVTLGSMFTVSVDENGESKVEEKEVNGTLTYKGDKALSEGAVIAVYDGILNEDNSVDGETGYYEITKVLGDGKYEYVQADFQDVIAIPDVIPVSIKKITDGATATVTKDDLKFNESLREVLGIDGDVTIDVGDYIAFYSGKLGDTVEFEDTVGANLEYYARVTSVSVKNGKTTFEFEIVPIEEIISSTDLHMKMGEVEPDIAEIDEEAIKSSMMEEIERSRLVEEASDYLCTAILDDEASLDKYQNKDKLEQMKFKTSDGEDITFEEVRKLASGGEKVKVDDVKVSFVVGSKLQHFEKKAGLRAEVTVSLKITISLGSAGSLEITPMIIFEQEVLISPMISVNAKWAYVLGFIPVMRYIDIDPTFECGTYTGFGLNVTIMTVGPESEDGEFSDLVNQYNDEAGDGKEKRKDVVKNLIKGGDTLKKMAELNKGASGKEWSKEDKGGNENENKGDDDDGPMQDFNSPGVGGDLPTKYSGMLGNDAEYIDLVNVEIGTFATPVDPFHLVEFSIGAYFVVSFKLNAMIGTGVTYENAKRFTYHIRRYVAQEGEDEKSSGQADLATPNFRADFYAFGMIGIRVGIRIDVRLGIISTKLASIGVTAEVGVYAEVYGFLYVWYEWTSGKGSTSGAMGSLYFEVGIYVEINFVAQLGDGQFSTGFTIYENTWPLVQLGAEFVPLDFTVEKGDDCLSVEYEEGTNTVTLPEDLYKINMMEMKSGEVSEESMDDTASVGEGKSFTMRGRTYTQYDEEHFLVECHDTDKDGNRLDTCSFIYLPATNEVMIKPSDTLATEVFGEVTLTYKNDSFGFNTMKMARTVSLHWEGTPSTATVEYYIEKEPGSGEYDLKEEGEFDGFNGIEYDLIVDKDFTYKYDGYRLNWVEFADTALFSERYRELIRLSEDAWNHYQKTMNPADYDEALEIAAKTEAAFQNYNNYGQNIVDTVENGEGTLYFLMASSDTVVKVYYNHITSDIAWRVWGDPEAEGEAGGLIGFGLVTDVPANSKIQDYVGDAQKVLDDYADAVTFEKAEFHTAENKDKTEALTEKSVMGKESIIVDFYANAKTYKLSWIYDDEMVKTEEVKAYAKITPAMPDLKYEEGYTLKSWNMKDLNDAVSFRGYRPDEYEEGTCYIMPAKDAKIVAEIEPEEYLAEWYYGDRRFATAMVPYGTQLSTYHYFTAISTDSKISWTISDGTSSAAFEESMTMPAKNVRFDAGIQERTEGSMKFMADGKEVAKLEGEGGKEVVIPDYKDEKKTNNGLALRWVSDGVVKITYDPGRRVRLPYDDMTFVAEWYCVKHRYDSGTITKEATCTEDGVMEVTCLNCGESFDVYIDAHGHSWDGGKVKVKETCTKDGVKEYTCTECGETRTEKIAAHGHSYGDGTLVRDADCIHAKLYSYICKECCDEYTKEEGTATGIHTYGTPEYTWNDDYSVVMAKAVCTVCGDVLAETVSTVQTDYTAPGIVTEGSVTYKAEFESKIFSAQTKTVTLPAGRQHTLYYYAGFGDTELSPYTSGTGGVLIVTIPSSMHVDDEFPVSELVYDVCLMAFVEGDVDTPSAVFRPRMSSETRERFEAIRFCDFTSVDIPIEIWENEGSEADADEYGGTPVTIRFVKE